MLVVFYDGNKRYCFIINDPVKKPKVNKTVRVHTMRHRGIRTEEYGILFVDAISTGIARRDSGSERRCRENQVGATEAVEASSKYYIWRFKIPDEQSTPGTSSTATVHFSRRGVG